MLTATLSCDHRAVDGVLGAEFLAAIKTLIETPLAPWFNLAPTFSTGEFHVRPNAPLRAPHI